jgi:hypothetical protein
MSRSASSQPIPVSSLPHPPEPFLRIDCDCCVARSAAVCADCVVTFLCTDGDPGPVDLDDGAVRTLRLLHRAGLVPGLRHLAPV